MKKKIGLLGGRFDPVHIAHLAMATAAANQLKLDEVRWIVTGKPVHKKTFASAKHRLRMVSLALKDLSDNCCVLFVSGTLEYVDADMEEMIKDMNRVSGGDMFIVTVNDMTGHYLYNFNPLANDFTETFNNPFKQKSKRIIYKAPPNYDYFDYKDNPNYGK